MGLSREPHDGKDITLSVDSKLQYIAFTSIKNAVEKFNAKAGAAVVLHGRDTDRLAAVGLDGAEVHTGDLREPGGPAALVEAGSSTSIEAMPTCAQSRCLPRT